MATGCPKSAGGASCRGTGASGHVVQDEQLGAVRGAHLAAEPAFVDPFVLMSRSVRVGTAVRVRCIHADDLREIDLRRLEHHPAFQRPDVEIPRRAIVASVRRRSAPTAAALFEFPQGGQLVGQVGRAGSPLQPLDHLASPHQFLAGAGDQVVFFGLKEPIESSLTFALGPTCDPLRPRSRTVHELCRAVSRRAFDQRRLRRLPLGIGRRAVRAHRRGPTARGSGSAESKSRTSSTQPWNGYSPLSDPISTRLTGDFRSAGESVLASRLPHQIVRPQDRLARSAVIDKHDVIPRAGRPGEFLGAEPGERTAVLPAEVQAVVVDFHLNAVTQWCRRKT